MALSRAGADRQSMHERLRQHALKAWDAVQEGQPNPLTESISSDAVFLSYLSEPEIQDLMDASGHLGDAPDRARRFAVNLREELIIS